MTNILVFVLQRAVDHMMTQAVDQIQSTTQFIDDDAANAVKHEARLIKPADL